MAEFKSTISSQNFDKALQGGLDYAADKSGIQEALKELSAKGFVYIGPDQPTDGTMYWLDTSVEEPDEPVVPDEPDVPDEPEVTLTSISATYNGGDVAVGTALTALTGIVVTATYSDGSTATVTGYTLSGEIAEGSNTITVTYEGKTATFTVTGVAEEEPGNDNLAESNIIATGLNGADIMLTNNETVMAQDKVYYYRIEPGEYYKLTIRARFTSAWGVTYLVQNLSYTDAANGTNPIITAFYNHVNDGYVVYEIDIPTLRTKFQEAIDNGTLDTTKGEPTAFIYQGNGHLLYNYTD